MRARSVLAAGWMAIALLGWSLAAAPSPALAAASRGTSMGVGYRPPVRAPITDLFRPPADRYGAGNRGIDYDTDPGTGVGASAAGEVVFAGAVGLHRHVVVLHPDGLRTSYSFLASVQVRRGDRVESGAVVGTSGDLLHFGVRSGDNYLDPLSLLDRPAFLVPESGAATMAPSPAPAALERTAVVDLVRARGVAPRSQSAAQPDSPDVMSQVGRALAAGLVAGVLAG